MTHYRPNGALCSAEPDRCISGGCAQPHTVHTHHTRMRPESLAWQLRNWSPSRDQLSALRLEMPEYWRPACSMEPLHTLSVPTLLLCNPFSSHPWYLTVARDVPHAHTHRAGQQLPIWQPNPCIEVECKPSRRPGTPVGTAYSITSAQDTRNPLAQSSTRAGCMISQFTYEAEPNEVGFANECAANAFLARTRDPLHNYPLNCPMIANIGRNMPATMKPTTTPRNTISIGSSAAVKPSTASSTSRS